MPRKQINAEKIFDCAVHLVESRGLEYLTMGNIAKELQIKPPSLYNHIRSIDDVKRAVATKGLECLYEKLYQVAESTDYSIYDISIAYVNFARQRPQLYLSTQFDAVMQDHSLQKISHLIVQLVAKSIQVDATNPTNTIHIIRGLRCLLHGFASLERIDGFGLPVDSDLSLSAMITIYLKGVKATNQSDHS